MKQFTRRNSAKQQEQLNSNENCPQSCQGPLANKANPVAAAEEGDPYSFDLDDTSQPLLTKASGAQQKEPSYKAKPVCKKVSSGKSITPAAPQPNSESVRLPSPKKQERPAALQHAVGPGVQSAETERTNTKAAAATNTTKQVSCPAAPSGKSQQPAAAPAAAPARGERGAGSSGQRGGASGSARSRPGVGANTGNSKAAGSGGNSRRPAAATGNKRTRASAEAASSQQQQPLQQRSSSFSPPASTPDQLTSPGPAGIHTGAVSLPTPHRRSRLSAGLLAGAAGGTEARPAQTVMEAQERGELVQLQDDASYAMDGLAPTCSIETQRDSAVTLTEMLSTRKGRVALRADGLAQQFLTSLAKLKAAKDCVLGLAATLSLWLLASEDANPCYFASVAAAVLVEQLLQYDYTFDDVAAKSAAGARLCRLVRARPLVNLLASTGVNSTRGLLLVALEQATSSQYASKAAAVEKLKHNLRLHGALQRLANVVAETAAVPGGAAAAAQQLHLLLLVLENATFTCPENGTALVEAQVGPGSKSSSKASKQQQGSAAEAASAQSDQQVQSFPAVLVGVARALLQDVHQEQARTALHVALSVLMNLIHDNRDGGVLICGVGGMDVAADIYSTLLQDSQGDHEALCAAVLQHLDLLSVALGVLINLVSNEPQHSRKLAAAGAGEAGSAASSSQGVSTFVQLLCTVVSALGQLLQQHMDQEEAGSQQAAAGPSSAAAGLPAGAKVVTSPSAAAEALGSNTASEASIVEVYSGMLLGFLVRDGDPDLAQAVAAQLPGSSLEPLTSATGRCLDFYVRTGAITDHTRTTLEQLLRHLVAVKAGLQPGGHQGSGPQQAPEVMEIE